LNVLYLRLDFWFGLKAGGSLTHTLGVVRALHDLGHRVAVLSSDALPTEMGLDVTVVSPARTLRLPVVRAVGPFFYNWQALGAGRRLARELPVDLIYQRHASLGLAGVWLGRELRRPLVLEVNNLVTPWARQMGERRVPGFEALAGYAERRALRGARVLSAVSSVVRDQLIATGLPPNRIVVNPNGVDASSFRPDVDGEPVRRRLGLSGRRVVGFVSTFGRWHGVEELAMAAARVSAQRPDVAFLFVGDGLLRERAERILREAGASTAVTFTGLVPHDEAPAYLAACDVLVSPHGKPPSGRFIGSPTKLFEYMAMGRGIVASALDQIGEVLHHDRTALLVPPGDVEALTAAIAQLVADPGLRRRLGAAARAAVVERFTWRHNVERILSTLDGAAAAGTA
jgi:glycosyltransferase involved in cell wall biosynthesis